MKELKIGDRYKDKRHTEQDVWEIIEVLTLTKAVMKCVDSGISNHFHIGERHEWDLRYTDTWEYVQDKSNNFKIIYDILNNP